MTDLAASNEIVCDSPLVSAGAGDDVHKSVGRNNLLRKILSIANYGMVVLGLVLFGISIWVLLKERNGGILSFLSRQGVFIRSPIAIGLCFMVAAAGCILAGYFVGVRHVAPSIVEGLRLGQRRKVFQWYIVICTGTVLVLGLIFFFLLPTLSSTKRTGILMTTWQDMSISHPDRICMYEIKNKCAGAKDQACALMTRTSVSKSCPGHYCTDTCKVTSPRPAKDKSLCAACLTSFQTAEELNDCRKSEARKVSSGACLPILRREVQHFLIVVVASSGTGLGLVLIVMALGTVSPILDSCV